MIDQRINVGSYTGLGYTGGNNVPILEQATQTAEQTEDGQWILMEENDHYNQEAKIGGPYTSLANLRRAAARRRKRLSVEEGEYEAAVADFDAAMAEEDHRLQQEVDAVAAQGLEALWAALAEDLASERGKKLGLAILAKLGVTADPAKVYAFCGHRHIQDAPEGLEQVKVPWPAYSQKGAYRYESREGFLSRQIVGYHAAGGPLVFVHVETARDPGLTTGEGLTWLKVYGAPGSWYQTRDSGTGDVRGFKFV